MPQGCLAELTVVVTHIGIGFEAVRTVLIRRRVQYAFLWYWKVLKSGGSLTRISDADSCKVLPLGNTFL